MECGVTGILPHQQEQHPGLSCRVHAVASLAMLVSLAPAAHRCTPHRSSPPPCPWSIFGACVWTRHRRSRVAPRAPPSLRCSSTQCTAGVSQVPPSLGAPRTCLGCWRFCEHSPTTTSAGGTEHCSGRMRRCVCWCCLDVVAPPCLKAYASPYFSLLTRLGSRAPSSGGRGGSGPPAAPAVPRLPRRSYVAQCKGGRGGRSGHTAPTRTAHAAAVQRH